MATTSTKKARKQISQPIGPRKSDNSSGSTYNIWYNKKVGERFIRGKKLRLVHDAIFQKIAEKQKVV